MKNQHFDKRSLILSILGLLLITFSTVAKLHGAEKSNKLRVLCYNIHYGQGMDGKYNIKRLAEAIKATKPDIVALQEVDVHVKRSGRIHEAKELSKLTGMKVRFGPTQHYEGGLFGNAVLTKLPILDVHIQPLPYTKSTPERITYPRAAIAVIVKLSNGEKLRFISTHFQHNIPEDREQEAVAINKHFAQADDNIPTILAGDMNAKPTSKPIEILLKKWKNAIDDEATPSSPSPQPRYRIDYIFYRPANRFKFSDAKVIPEKMASDHRPVFAEFELLPKNK